MATANNIYTTRQAASIGLQPGNLIGETTYVTETKITPPIKQRIRNQRLLSTNISRCQCCCPPFASTLCRSCLCPCWAYLLLGLIFALLLAGLAVEIGFLTREKIRTRTQACTQVFNTTNTFVDNGGQTTYDIVTVTSVPCPPNGQIISMGTPMSYAFSYLVFIMSFFIHFLKR